MITTSRLQVTGVTGGPLRITGATLVNGAYELATAGGADYELQTERQVMLDNILFIPGISAIPEATAEDSLGNPLTPIDYTDGDGKDWRAFEFLTSGELIVTRGGRIERLLAAGGGGGGSRAHGGGGGGAGGLLQSDGYIPVGTHAVVVGAGGAGGADTGAFQGSNGGNSSFYGQTALGGGGGGAASIDLADAVGRNGGCGGGGGRANAAEVTPLFNSGGTGSQGGNGGASSNRTAPESSRGGGGGGASGNGSDGVLSTDNTPGGPGLAVAISGTSKTYSVGGIGSMTGSRNAIANTGNGGGGVSGGTLEPGGNGGSGVVVVRFRR